MSGSGDNGIKDFLIGQFAGLNTAVSRLTGEVATCREKVDEHGRDLTDLRISMARYRDDSERQVTSLRAEVMLLGARYRARAALWTAVAAMLLVGAGAVAKALLMR